MYKNILVTGGSGFIGVNLINYLSKKKYKIFNVDKISYCSTKEKYIKLNKKKYFFFKGNIQSKVLIKKILRTRKIHTIVHLASESHVDRSIERPLVFIKQNIISTTTLYSSVKELLKEKSISNPNIIHISTDEVFGSISKKKSASESYTFSPNSPYSASKASTECIARSFVETYGLKISIVRLCNNYGPYQFPEKFIPTCILNSINNKSIPIYGQGKNVREWMYVLDSCKVLEKIIKNFQNKVNYNIGSNFTFTNLQIIKLLKKILKKDIDVRYVFDRPGHDLRYSLNSNKFRKKFNWKPKYTFEEGLEKTIKWYRNNNPWIKDTLKNYKGERLGKI